jgi:hypothetical protein
MNHILSLSVCIEYKEFGMIKFNRVVSQNYAAGLKYTVLLLRSSCLRRRLTSFDGEEECRPGWIGVCLELLAVR